MSHTIRRLRESRGLTQRELGALIGVSDKAVSTWEKGEKTPRRAPLQKMAALFGVPVGALLEDAPATDDFAHTLERLCAAWNATPATVATATGISRGKLLRLLRGTAVPTPDDLARLEHYFGVPLNYTREPTTLFPATLAPACRIPVLGRVPAGVPVEAVADVVDHIDLTDADGRDYFALLVKGDSMTPEYRSDDIVVVRVQPTADSGDDVVAYVGDSDATLKRFARTENGIELRPLNPDYPVLRFSNEEITALPITIAGVVVEQRRRKQKR